MKRAVTNSNSDQYEDDGAYLTKISLPDHPKPNDLLKKRCNFSVALNFPISPSFNTLHLFFGFSRKASDTTCCGGGGGRRRKGVKLQKRPCPQRPRGAHNDGFNSTRKFIWWMSALNRDRCWGFLSPKYFLRDLQRWRETWKISYEPMIFSFSLWVPTLVHIEKSQWRWRKQQQQGKQTKYSNKTCKCSFISKLIVHD